MRAADLDMNFDAVPGSVPAARHAAARWAATEGAQGPDLYQICLAVSEAVTNAVVHAYSQGSPVVPDGPEVAPPGQIHLSATAGPGELTIFVGDEGCGIGRAMASPGLGLGLAVIDESCESLTIRTRSGGGIELEMRFRLRQWNDSIPPRQGITRRPDAPAPDPAFGAPRSAGLRRRGRGRGPGPLARRSIGPKVHEDAGDQHPYDEG